MSTSHPPQAQTGTHVEADVGTRHVGHPGPKEYVAVAVILAIITGIEVLVYYLNFLQAAIVPIFIVLSLTKFVLVAMFFMHLKFDSRFFSVVFVTGLLLAVGVFIVFLSMVRVFFA